MGVTLGQQLNDIPMISSAADTILALPAVKPEEKAKFGFFKGAVSGNPALMVQSYEAGYKEDGTETTIAAAY
jgi:hypothetical protein